ncbi:hypothetical protein ECC26_03835 [Helicobacter pylori]|nr:hypothetical protein ECC26_03835 [Helicobacter pylori]
MFTIAFCNFSIAFKALLQLDSMILLREFLRSTSVINSLNCLKWHLYNNNTSALKKSKNFCLFL